MSRAPASKARIAIDGTETFSIRILFAFSPVDRGIQDPLILRQLSREGQTVIERGTGAQEDSGCGKSATRRFFLIGSNLKTRSRFERRTSDLTQPAHQEQTIVAPRIQGVGLHSGAPVI